jgi:hypothetical protein
MPKVVRVRVEAINPASAQTGAESKVGNVRVNDEPTDDLGLVRVGKVDSVILDQAYRRL